MGMLRLRVANHHSATVRADPPIFAEDEAAVAEAYAALPRLGGGRAPVRPLAKSIRFVADILHVCSHSEGAGVVLLSLPSPGIPRAHEFIPKTLGGGTTAAQYSVAAR